MLPLFANKRWLCAVCVLSGLFYQCQTKQHALNDGMSKFVSDKNFEQIHGNPVPATLDSIGKMVSFRNSAGQTEKVFFIQVPDSKKTLLVFHEWWGLNDNIKKECQRLSKALPEVNILALDLYSGQVATNPEDAGKFMKSVNNEKALDVIKSAVKSFASDHKLGSIGWCFGGGWSLQTAILLPDQLKSCVIYYGMPETDASRLVKIQARVLGIFADNDAWITPEVVKTFDETMNAVGKPFKYYSFAAEHAFANPSGSRFNEKAAVEANKIALDFIKESL